MNETQSAKTVMLSVRPEWCNLIANGEKTLEVRKTRQKLGSAPFRCFIYQTKPKHGDCNERDGRVIAEFICDYVNVFTSPENYTEHGICIALKCPSRMSEKELWKYGEGKPLYGWHISQLKIYDEPRYLAEFGLTRPPQSWCYVEEREDE